MSRQIGSQFRESLDEAGMILIAEEGDEVVLFDTVTDNYELWVRNDHFSGYVVEIHGIGYEFVRTADKADMRRLGC